jgi:NAD(P)-dependent dehydrogenase (short-subunit alcohol dehydrogenase family)
VTGTSSGLGRRFAQVLHGAGARVVQTPEHVQDLVETNLTRLFALSRLVGRRMLAQGGGVVSGDQDAHAGEIGLRAGSAGRPPASRPAMPAPRAPEWRDT